MKNNIDIKNIPQQPGVYFWKNANNDILYIGKAKNLKNRIKQYLNGSLNSYKTSSMLKQSTSVEFQICSNEKEALLLEQALIKKYHPYFNILLLDDKKYPYIVVELKNQSLSIETCFFYKEKKNAFYYGPLPTGYGYKGIKDYLIQECLYEKGIPIKSKDESFWKLKFEYAKKILSKNNNEFIKKIESKMIEASENEQYELALNLRDLIYYLKNQQTNDQAINLDDNLNTDVIVFNQEKKYLLILVHHFINGSFSLQEEFILEIKTSLEETQNQFINQFYLSRPKPKKILTNIDLEKDLLINQNTKIIKPQKGKYFLAIKNAIKNNEINKEKRIVNFESRQNQNKTILNFFELMFNKQIQTIMIIDNSHLANKDIVSVIAYYQNFEPIYSNWRKYDLKNINLSKKADPEYIYFGLEKYFSNDKNQIPDLLIVDGGKEQLKKAQKIIKKFNLEISLISLVKNDKHKLRSIIDNNLNEIKIVNQNVYNFLAKIQIEVDEYAKRYHSKKLISNSLEGSLSEIDGIGDVTEKKLLNYFKTYNNIYNASKEELEKVVSASIAKKIITKFKK